MRFKNEFFVNQSSTYENEHRLKSFARFLKNVKKPLVFSLFLNHPLPPVQGFAVGAMIFFSWALNGGEGVADCFRLQNMSQYFLPPANFFLVSLTANA